MCPDARIEGSQMATDLALRGICSIVQCARCPQKISNLCPGCRARDAKALDNVGERCGILVCTEQRKLESCFYCQDFPCDVFLSTKSLLPPKVSENGEMIDCGVVPISHHPAEISRNLIRRLTKYLMVIEHGINKGRGITTSSEFASALGIKPELVRKDLAGLGRFGIPHVGFDLHKCRLALRKTLNLNATQNIVWIGLEQPYALEQIINQLTSLGCRVVAIFDCKGNYVGKMEEIGNVRIFDFDELERIKKNLNVVGGVVACEEDCAQTAADKLMELGICSILNMTSVPLDHSEDVFIRNIDISEDFMLFSFYCGT